MKKKKKNLKKLNSINQNQNVNTKYSSWNSDPSIAESRWLVQDFLILNGSVKKYGVIIVGMYICIQIYL